MVLVSHDPHLIGLVAERLWLVAGGTVSPFDRDLEDYRRLLEEARRAERSHGRAAKARARDDRAGAPASKRDKRRVGAQARAAAAHLRKAARRAEARLEALTAERDSLEARLADPATYNGPGADMQALQTRFAELSRAVAEAEEAWLQAQAAVEQETARPQGKD